MDTYKIHDSLMNHIDWILEDYCVLYGDVDEDINKKHQEVCAALSDLISTINNKNKEIIK